MRLRPQSSVQAAPPSASAVRDVAGHKHVVEFYEGETALVRSVTGFVAPALRDGDAAIVVATQAHRMAFGAALTASGVDVATAVADGRYLAFDAAERLDAFMVGGAPDQERFNDVVGGVIKRASAGGRKVSIYGEMVALLWDAGGVVSAIALEDLWNDLANSWDFTLLCAYPMSAFDSAACGDEFLRICDQHSTVIPTEDYAMFGSADAQQRTVARLQQQAVVLKADVGRLRADQISERKKSEAALAQARDEASAASRAKSDFLAVMSHEIRTPMNGVIGLTGLLLDGPLSETQRHNAEGVRTSGEALLGIINNILDFSKIEAGQLELEAVDFALPEALDEVAGLVAESAQAKGLELVVDCRPELPTMLWGDVGRLRQILLNLTANALKFTQAGEVVLRASAAEEPAPGRVVIRFDVTDTGIGIDPATATRLFEPFSQADASTTRRHGGTGLGLAICRRLAEAMEGAIGLSSRPGQGADFWVQLPFSIKDERAHASFRPSLEGYRVLVVDDNQTNRVVLAAQLQAWDVEADPVANAEEALLQLRAAAAINAYDAAVVDMEMPGTDGIELARMVRADPDLAATPLLLLSSVPVEAEVAAAAGFAARLMKPVRLGYLRDALVQAMSPAASVPQLPTVGLAPAPATTPTSRGTVLVVDDHAINQEVAMGILRKLRYSFDTAGDGVEALAALERRSYDAVLMDCRMPQMDGFEATREIRRREAGRGRLPIVAMTADALGGDREKCIAAGMDDYLSKPVKDRELEGILNRLISGVEGGARQLLARAAPPQIEASGVLDLEQLHELRDLVDDRDDSGFLRDLVEQYLKEAECQLAELRRVTLDGQSDAIRAAAHGLKGSSATMGAKSVAEACLALELVAGEGQTPAPEAVESISAELERAAAALRFHCHRAV